METNRQNYVLDNNSMQHMNVAGAGDGVVGGVQAEVVSGIVGGVAGEILGGKYDEHHEVHDGGDDDELKYVEEVQQSEKQQQQQLQTLKNFGLDDDGTYESNELAEKETSDVIGHGFGNGNGGFLFGGDHQTKQQEQQHDFFKIGNGHDANGHDININDDFGNLISTGFEEKLNMMESEIDILKNEGDGDSYSTSNVTESVEAFVPQIDVKIEAKSEQQEMADEEEPSSLATNTTNGTSSLSENVPPQAAIEPQADAFDDFMVNMDNKENSDLLTTQKPHDLDLDQAYSQLNPDAKEFIPAFGSNPTSPTSPFASGVPQNEPVLSDIMETRMYFGQTSSAVPQHLLCDDDFVAHSPSKGKGDNNMDAVSLPILSDFEKEADKRPHELELEGIDDIHQRDEVMTPDQATQQLPLDDLETQDKENKDPMDLTDFRPLNFMDHGPETCVDLEADLDMQHSLQGEDEDDVMKRSMYVASDDVIEDVLNSVQPIPTENDSINNSFIEESATESATNQLANDKELLQVEEKEHVSNSPSTEELQMNLQNTLNSSNKDIPQLPIDLDNANNMQESIYMGQEKEQQDEEQQDEEQQEEEVIEQQLEIQDEMLPIHSELHCSQEKLQHDLQEDLPNDNQPDPEDQNLQESQQHQEEIQILQREFEHEVEEQHLEEQSENPNELHYDQQPTQDPINEQAPETLLADTTNSLIESVSVLDNVLETQELEQEINEVSNTPAIESLNFDAPVNYQETMLSDVMTPSLTADEKYLPEETKEPQFCSMSGLEQQMSEMMLKNDESGISQAEEVAATTATIAVEDMSENVIRSDEPVVDDSFNQHELECEQQHLQELQQQEMDIEPTEIEPEIESIIEQQHQQELASEMVVEEPIIEAKPAAPLFTDEETEIVTESEEKPELPPNIVAEATEAELLEPDMPKHNETEILKSADETTTQQVIEEVKVESVKEPEVEELKTKEEDTLAEAVKIDVPVEAVIAAATAAAATTAAVATKVASSPSKNKAETIQSSVSKTAAPKPKVASATANKKPAEVTKKPIGLVAKQRTAPAKPPAAPADKKPIVKTTFKTTTTAPRKAISAAANAAAKVVAKTTSSTSSTARAAATTKTTNTSKPTTAPRTASSGTATAARKPATTNGTMAKQRPVSAPTKPTTLGLVATNSAAKAKPTSPREALASQVRKVPSAATTGAKSPVSKTASSNVAARTKSTTSTVSSTAGTAGKTFTARPAPKFTSSSSTTTTTTTTRRSVTAQPTTAPKVTSSPLRKSTPSKPTTGKAPTKPATTTGGGLKSKTPITKTTSPPSGKPAPIRKPVDKTAAVTNGDANANKELIGTGENITTPAKEQHQLASTENGDLKAVQLEHTLENGDSSIPMQTEKQQQSFLEPRDEQIPMDLINA